MEKNLCDNRIVNKRKGRPGGVIRLYKIMRKTLIVVDMQNDFIDGALGTSEAASIVENVKKKIKEYSENGGEVIFTRDTQ